MFSDFADKLHLKGSVLFQEGEFLLKGVEFLIECNTVVDMLLVAYRDGELVNIALDGPHRSSLQPKFPSVELVFLEPGLPQFLAELQTCARFTNRMLSSVPEIQKVVHPLLSSFIMTKYAGSAG